MPQETTTRDWLSNSEDARQLIPQEMAGSSHFHDCIAPFFVRLSVTSARVPPTGLRTTRFLRTKKNKQPTRILILDIKYVFVDSSNKIKQTNKTEIWVGPVRSAVNAHGGGVVGRVCGWLSP
jgi:hypothetical protein